MSTQLFKTGMLAPFVPGTFLAPGRNGRSSDHSSVDYLTVLMR